MADVHAVQGVSGIDLAERGKNDERATEGTQGDELNYPSPESPSYLL